MSTQTTSAEEIDRPARRPQAIVATAMLGLCGYVMNLGWTGLRRTSTELCRGLKMKRTFGPFQTDPSGS